MKVTKLVMLVFISLFLIQCEKPVEIEFELRSRISGYVKKEFQLYISDPNTSGYGTCDIRIGYGSNVTVKLLGSSNYETTTDEYGYYKFDNIPEGAYDVVALGKGMDKYYFFQPRTLIVVIKLQEKHVSTLEMKRAYDWPTCP